MLCKCEFIFLGNSPELLYTGVCEEQQFKDRGGEGLGVKRERCERGLGESRRSKGVERQFGGRDCGWIVRSLK